MSSFDIPNPPDDAIYVQDNQYNVKYDISNQGKRMTDLGPLHLENFFLCTSPYIDLTLYDISYKNSSINIEKFLIEPKLGKHDS